MVGGPRLEMSLFETFLTYGAGALFFAILLIPLMMRLRSPNEELAKRLEDDRVAHKISWQSLSQGTSRDLWRERAASVHLYRREGRASGSEAEGASQAEYHLIVMDQEERVHEVEMTETDWGIVAPRGRELAAWLGVDFEDASYGADVDRSSHMVP